MIYREEHMDLFSISEDYYLAHCISADFAMGKGIAVEFNKRFNMRKKLKDEFPDFINDYMHYYKIKGECILIDNVLNLITKERYYQKPTYESLTQSLEMMKRVCKGNNIKKIAMPKIGCGLDRLKWDKVKEILFNIFKDTDIEILVCYL